MTHDGTGMCKITPLGMVLRRHKVPPPYGGGVLYYSFLFVDTFDFELDRSFPRKENQLSIGGVEGQLSL